MIKDKIIVAENFKAIPVEGEMEMQARELSLYLDKDVVPMSELIKADK